MNKVSAFFRLIRWLNLVFIALTQILFFYCIAYSNRVRTASPSHEFYFYLMVAGSLLIAAGGNIINDYFDIHIDRINKPHKLVIDKYIKRRWAIVLHLLLSSIGIALSAYVSYQLRQPILLIGNAISAMLLWFYSTTLKRKFLIGNLVVASLTAWVLMVVFIFSGGEFALAYNTKINQPAFFKLTVLYSGFAFLMTLIREVIKDMEDLIGDAEGNCKTMPIVWGINPTKVFVFTLALVAVIVLALIALYLLNLHTWVPAIYLFFAVILQIVLLMIGLKNAQESKDFKALSGRTKRIIFTGILSMIFFLFF